MLRALVVLSVLAQTGCATQRYDWNLAHQHLSPKMQEMPQADIREITRLVSERSSAPIVCMRYTGSKSRYPNEVWVVAAGFHDNGRQQQRTLSAEKAEWSLAHHRLWIRSLNFAYHLWRWVAHLTRRWSEPLTVAKIYF